MRKMRLILKFYLFKMGRIHKLFEDFSLKPANTILLSFFIVILAGTALFMLPFTTIGKGGLAFIDALFTSTSAVCVTGLIVVDTAAAYTFWGKLVLLLLIQIGGLGIMILSSFALFASRQRVSFEDKLVLSYMLSEDNVNKLSNRIRAIIYSTFAIEVIGALLLLPFFSEGKKIGADAFFSSLFHAVSAFCNAGFALYSDSFEGFRSSLHVNGVLSLLIILGGISFAVIYELYEQGVARLKRSQSFQHRKNYDRKFSSGGLSLNSRVVLIGTVILLLCGTIFFYAAEHTGALSSLTTAEQYLAAFFQSVTLRTAGFNTLPIGSLATGTLLIMMIFMGIGAAQGSTAGGIKINTAAVIVAYVRSILRGKRQVLLHKYTISAEYVQKAFLILLFAISMISVGAVLLSFSEPFALDRILFETVSAFATVGLSTGITGDLTSMGKSTLIILMFFGRLGPLTILAAVSKPEKGVEISYPEGEISI